MCIKYICISWFVVHFTVGWLQLLEPNIDYWYFSTIQCLNKDGVIITLDVTYQYKAQAAKLHDIAMNFKDYDGYKEVLQYTGKKVAPFSIDQGAVLLKHLRKTYAHI